MDLYGWYYDSENGKWWRFDIESSYQFAVDMIDRYYYEKDLSQKNGTIPIPSVKTKDECEKSFKREIKKVRSLDFVIESSNGECIYDHYVVPVYIDVNVRKTLGNIEEVRAEAYYCEECNCYYIAPEEATKLKENGTPLFYSDIKKLEQKNRKSEENNNTDDYYDILYDEDFEGFLKLESKLHKRGYSVSQKDNLSDNERQCILLEALDNKIYKKGELIYFLEKTIARNGKSKKNALALAKWKRDLEFVKNYRG